MAEYEMPLDEVKALERYEKANKIHISQMKKPTNNTTPPTTGENNPS